MTLEEFENIDYEEYEVYDEETGEWVDLNKSCYRSGGFPDPEVAREKINAITISVNRKKYVISTFDYNAPEGVEFIHAKNEAALLAHFVKLWVKSDLDIISGWNIDFFDIPYMYNRITKILGEKFANALSPVNKVSSRKVNTKFGQRTKINITGVESLDYQQLYDKFTYTPRASMKLDYIAHCELGEKKIDYSEEGGKLHLLYLNNPQKFLDYNLHDVVLVERLDDKLKLIGLAQTLAFRMKVNFGDVFSQVRMWEVKMSNNMVDRGIQPEYSSSNIKTEKFKGAFVKDPNIGYYRNVCSFDLTSLYPKIIEQNNISPETMLDPSQFFDIEDDDVAYDHAKMASVLNKATEMNAVIASNGSLYDKSKKGLFPTIVAEVFDERVIAKNKMKEAKNELQKAKEELAKRGLANP